MASATHPLIFLYSAADIFLLPSRQDNLPNVMLESLACGTPIISFNIGGMADEILHGKNGLLANEVSASGLTNAVENFFKTGIKWKREEIRNFAVQKFEPTVQVDALLQLYNSSLR